MFDSNNRHHKNNLHCRELQMARRKKTSPLEDWMDLVAMLPWWVGILLAFVSYISFHALSSPPKVVSFKPADMSALMTGTVVSGVAMVAQFIVPLVCLFGALGSFVKRKRRASLVINVAQAKSTDALEGMSWQEFELLVGEAFRLQGYSVTETGAAGPDGGVDLVLAKGTEKFFVQCKQWKAFKVGVTTVRELYGVMAARGGTGGFVVTSGLFSDDAHEFAAGRNIRLVDGPKLFALIKQARNVRMNATERRVNTPVAEPILRSAMACPACGAAMKLRTAKRGANAGSEFWGCTTYPACKGTRSV
jgi:restriction system protein